MHALLRRTGWQMSVMPAWFSEQVPGHPSLGSDGNHRKQKAHENIIEQRDMFQPKEASQPGSFRHVALI